MKPDRALRNKINEIESKIRKIERRSEKKRKMSTLDRDSINRYIAQAEALEWALDDGSLYTDL